MEQYVVRTSLARTPSRPYVEEIIQMRSRVQAAGSSVFSLAVLNEFEKTGAIPTTMIFIGGSWEHA